MYDIRDHVLQRSVSSEKTYTLTCKEGSFLLPDAELVVYWKQEYHRMHAVQIGDGMKLVLRYEAPAIDVTVLPVHAIEQGLAVYKEYDEDTDARLVYLYKYAAGDAWRQIINRYLQHIGSTGTLTVEKWFTRLRWIEVQSSSFLATPHSFSEYLAYMVGICLAYGKPKQIVDARVISWHVGLPMLWSLAEQYPLFQQMREVLAEAWIFMVHSVQNQQVGSLVQLTIHDAWLLDILEGIRFDTQATSSRYEQLNEKLLTFLWEENTILANSVLKFVSK